MSLYDEIKKRGQHCPRFFMGKIGLGQSVFKQLF